MADYTPNLNLKKPQNGEPRKVEDLNNNFDLIDEKVGNLSDSVGVSIVQYGASPTKTKTENKTALQSAISDVNSKGGGLIVVPHNINYGYQRNTPSSHPDFTGVTTDIFILDYSIGSTYTPSGWKDSRDGEQVRKWFFTKNQGDGIHDGNGEWIRGGYHPYLYILHDGKIGELNERRATVWFGNNGVGTWGVGQGIYEFSATVNNVGGYPAGTTTIKVGNASRAIPFSGDPARKARFASHRETEYTATYVDATTITIYPALSQSVLDSELIYFSTTENDDPFLSPFKIVANNLAGRSGLETVMSILKVNGNIGFYVSEPQYDYHLVGKGDGTVFFKSEIGDAQYMLQTPGGAKRKYGLRNSDGYFFLTNNGATAHVMRVSAAGDLLQLISQSTNVNVELTTQSGKTRKISIRNDNGTFNITNLAQSANVFVLTDAGNGQFSAGVSGGSFASTARPTGVGVGTQIFDTTLNKPIWYGSSGWVDATGATV